MSQTLQTPDPVVDGGAPAPATPRWVWGLAALPGLLHLLPRLVGWWTDAPPERVFLGFRHMLADQISYLGLAEFAGQLGRVALPTPYVTEAQDGRFVMAFIALVGNLARLLHVDVLWVWYAAGPLFGWLFFVTVWLLIRAMLPTPRQQRLAFVLACCAGGLDWLVDGVASLVWADFAFSAEAVALFWNWSLAGAAVQPMWLAGYNLIVVAALLLWTRRADAPRRRPGWWLLALPPLMLASFAVHPYTGLAAIPLLAVLALTAELADRRPGAALPRLVALARPLTAVAAGALLIAALGLWARQDEVYARTSDILRSWRPHYGLGWYPLLYGLPLPLAFGGALAALRRGERWVWWALAWLLTTVGLSLLPLLPGVKFQYLVHLPLCLLAGRGLDAWLALPDRWGAALRRPAVAVLLWLLLLAGPPVAVLRSLPVASDPVYVSAPQLELLAALRALPAGNVLSPPAASLLIPWKAGKPVYDGHWFLSYQHRQRLDTLRQFYFSGDVEAARRLLREQRIRYVLEDPWTLDRLVALQQPLQLVERYRNPFGRILEVQGVAEQGS